MMCTSMLLHLWCSQLIFYLFHQNCYFKMQLFTRTHFFKLTHSSLTYILSTDLVSDTSIGSPWYYQDRGQPLPATFQPQGLSQVKTYACQVCGRVFGRKDFVARHMRIHTGERPFKCDHCGKEFKHQQSLKVHVFKTHSSVGKM